MGSIASPVAGKLAARSAAVATVKTENFTKVSDALYRGGYPELSDLKGLVAMGVTTDISLMGGDSSFESEAVAQEAKAAKSLGLTFVNLRVPFKVAFPRAMADQFLSIVTQAEASTRGGHAVYLHCRHGRDRTGTMVAVYRMSQDHFTNAKAFAPSVCRADPGLEKSGFK